MWKVQAKDLRILPCEYEHIASATSIMPFQKHIFVSEGDKECVTSYHCHSHARNREKVIYNTIQSGRSAKKSFSLKDKKHVR